MNWRAVIYFGRSQRLNTARLTIADLYLALKMTEPTRQEIHEMRQYMTVVEPRRETGPRLVQPLPAARRVTAITEHLYQHLQRADADDLHEGLGNRVEAVLTVQVIDALYESLRAGDDQQVVALSRPLFERLEYCTPEQIAAILGRNGFRGQELDVAGLVGMLGEALADLDGRPRPRPGDTRQPFDDLIGDLAVLVTEWSGPQSLTEGQDRGTAAPDCAERLRTLLGQYGITVEAHRG
jgi:hypothetical protein